MERKNAAKNARFCGPRCRSARLAMERRCVTCGCQPQHGKNKCDTCAAKNTARATRWRKEKALAGLCIACGRAPLAVGGQRCVDCVRRQRNGGLRHKYGKDLAWYEATLLSQGGSCAICGLPESKGNKGVLDVDHDHATGVVRGLLCSGCNKLLHSGLTAEHLRRAAAYLEGVAIAA